MSLYYLDTSAALKLLAQENDSMAFAAFYDAHITSPWVTSALLRIELIRAASHRAHPRCQPGTTRCAARGP